ncbi:MAG: COP23 domain-containing protein [Cyanobacteriota bacterium]|nr:COP23 domain-containing protein [Cyanobacteriota bacterium]
MNRYLLSLGCAGLVSYQLLATILTAQAQIGTISKPNIIVAQENKSKKARTSISTQPPNSQTTGYSRRRAIRYRFECNSNNQTVLAIYQARRDRRGNIVSLWKKITDRPLIQWTKEGATELDSRLTPQRGNIVSLWKKITDRPLIQWTKEGATELDSRLTPQKRCQTVTANFNYHFLRIASRPRLPPLSEGILKEKAVICAAPEGGCNDNNVLWTLRNDNQNSNGQIIRQLLSALRGEASSSIIMESQDDEEIEVPSEVNMENIIDAIIEQESEKFDEEDELPE